MGLINEIGDERCGSELVDDGQPPPLPGEGEIVYMMGCGPYLIIGRLAEYDILATVRSWCIGDKAWTRLWVS